MRMIKLTMNAFMTYKDKTTIDFTQLLDHGIYLISGPTGAGKTTIFDAMTFALYGVASGSHRNQSYFRSDFADCKEETYVELTFELHQKIYQIKRSPTYTRPGYKTAKMANAFLSYDDEIIEGVKEVNQKINQLLGVDVHQFKQIVMIAQGEFTKLIYASSEEREKVLRHIFHSEPLVIFENMLKEESKLYKDQYALSSQQLLSRFQLLSLPEDFMKEHQDGFHPSFIEDAQQENQHIHETMTKAHQDYLHCHQQYDDLYQIYYQKEKKNQDYLEYQSLQKHYQELISQQEYMNQLHFDIQKLKVLEQNQSFLYQYQKTQTDLKKSQQQLQTLESSQKILTQQFDSIEEAYQNISTLQSQKDECLLFIDKIKQAIQKQKEFQTINQHYLKLQKTYQEQFIRYQEFEDKHHKLQKRMERDQENVNHLPKLQLELQQNEQLVKEMNQRRVSIHDLSELYDRLTDDQDKHFELSKTYKQKDEEYQKVLQTYQEEDENFKRQQAGILALSLQDNQPCPVCGSLHHPHLATLSKHILNANELEELSQEVERKKALKEEAYQDVLLQNNQVHEIRSQIQILKKQLNIEEELSKEVFIHLLSDIIQVTKNQEKTYQKRHNEVEYLKKVKHSLEKDQILFNQQSQKLESWLKDQHNQEKQLAIYQTQLKQLKTTDDSLEQLNQQYNDYQNQLKQLENQIQDIDTKYHQIQKEISVLSSQKEQLSKQIDHLCQLEQALQSQFDELISTHFQDLDTYNKYQGMLKDLAIKEQQYQDYIIEKQTLLAQLKSFKESLQDYTFTDLSQEQVKLKELEELRDQALKNYNAYHHTYEQNENIIQTIRKDYQKNQDIFEKYTMYQDLSDITSGKNGQRMSFERYVLSSYFEHILEYANIELLKMTHGRFAMHRKQATKGAKQQGLDLSVLDYETGIMRDVQSLSGGESFKAALALALGLSSMIQSYAGGIELNTLFIDEGFGTLDSESIDQALSVLLDLKNDHKVIGIISHVDELKEKIETQIVVEKGQQGSSLHIETA